MGARRSCRPDHLRQRAMISSTRSRELLARWRRRSTCFRWRAWRRRLPPRSVSSTWSACGARSGRALQRPPTGRPPPRHRRSRRKRRRVATGREESRAARGEQALQSLRPRMTRSTASCAPTTTMPRLRSSAVRRTLTSSGPSTAPRGWCTRTSARYHHAFRSGASLAFLATTPALTPPALPPRRTP